MNNEKENVLTTEINPAKLIVWVLLLNVYVAYALVCVKYLNVKFLIVGTIFAAFIAFGGEKTNRLVKDNLVLSYMLSFGVVAYLFIDLFTAARYS